MSAAADNPLKLEEFLCFAIYSTAHAFNRVYAPLLEKIGLTYPQYLVMTALWQQDDQTVGDLGAHLALESNTITPLLKRLETAGHITRARDSKDERQVRVRLTPAGKSLQGEAAHIPGCILAATGMSVDDIHRLHADIARLRGALDGSRG